MLLFARNIGAFLSFYTLLCKALFDWSKNVSHSLRVDQEKAFEFQVAYFCVASAFSRRLFLFTYADHNRMGKWSVNMMLKYPLKYSIFSASRSQAYSVLQAHITTLYCKN